MVVVGVAVRTGVASTVVAVGVRTHSSVPSDDFEVALIARKPRRAAGRRSKDVVRVHRPDDQHRTVPRGPAGAALQPGPGAGHARHADGGQVAGPVPVHDGNRRIVVSDRRQVEGAVQERKGIVHGHRGLADGTVDTGDATRAEDGQEERSGLVRPVGTLVFRSDVVRVPGAARKRVEDRHVRPTGEYAAPRRLLPVGEELGGAARRRGVEPTAASGTRRRRGSGRRARGTRSGRARGAGQTGATKTVVVVTVVLEGFYVYCIDAESLRFLGG